MHKSCHLISWNTKGWFFTVLSTTKRVGNVLHEMKKRTIFSGTIFRLCSPCSVFPAEMLNVQVIVTWCWLNDALLLAWKGKQTNKCYSGTASTTLPALKVDQVQGTSEYGTQNPSHLMNQTLFGSGIQMVQFLNAPNRTRNQKAIWVLAQFLNGHFEYRQLCPVFKCFFFFLTRGSLLFHVTVSKQ
jgi:hypothetical protein